MISVIGSEVNSARWKSSSNAPLICSSALAPPNSPTKKPGLDSATDAIAARVSVAASVAFSASPGSSKLTTAECPSSEIAPLARS